MILMTTLVLSALAFLLLYQLGGLTNFKISPLEAETIASASSLKAILDNSLYLPLKLLIYGLSFIPMEPVFLRLASVLIGFLTAVYFYIILRALHTRRITALGITLFATSSWFLQTTRVVTPVVMVLYSLTALMFLSLWLPHAKHRNWAFVFATTIAASLVYAPGFLPLLIILVAAKPKHFTAIIKTVPNWVLGVSAGLFLVMVAPLAYSLVMGSLSLRTYLGIPMLIEPLEWLKRLAIIPAYLFARGPFEPVFNVARLPLLDMFTTVLAMLGVYAYFFQLRLSRTGLLAILTIFSVIMIALNGALWLPLLLPIVYILMTMGIAVLMQKWFTVFPKNPLARAVGVGVLCIALTLVSVYHLTRYYLVWPNTTATKITFTQTD